mgnify:CR=1 FL=1
MGRNILAYITGILTGFLVVVITRTITLSYYPFPEELTWFDSQDMELYINSLPDGAFWAQIVAHIVGAFLAGLITSLVNRKGRFIHGIIAGGVIFVFTIVSNFTFGFPGWYIIVDTLLTGVAAFAGASFGQSRDV